MQVAKTIKEPFQLCKERQDVWEPVDIQYCRIISAFCRSTINHHHLQNHLLCYLGRIAPKAYNYTVQMWWLLTDKSVHVRECHTYFWALIYISTAKSFAGEYECSLIPVVVSGPLVQRVCITGLAMRYLLRSMIIWLVIDWFLRPVWSLLLLVKHNWSPSVIQNCCFFISFGPVDCLTLRAAP